MIQKLRDVVEQGHLIFQHTPAAHRVSNIIFLVAFSFEMSVPILDLTINSIIIIRNICFKHKQIVSYFGYAALRHFGVLIHCWFSNISLYYDTGRSRKAIRKQHPC